MVTHDRLVAVGARWLFNTKRCPVVLTEFPAGEIPDVLGYNGWASTEIEVKVSLSDFRADRHKASRRDPTRGIATRRYYLVPESLVPKVEQQLPTGWGLIYLAGNGRSVRVRKESQDFEVDRREDMHILLSLMRRLAGMNPWLKGVQVRCYTDYSWFEREHLVNDARRAGVELSEAEIARKLEPRARLLVRPQEPPMT